MKREACVKPVAALAYPWQSSLLFLQDGLNVVSEARVAGEDLQGRHRKRKNKEERMKSVLEGWSLLHTSRCLLPRLSDHCMRAGHLVPG